MLASVRASTGLARTLLARNASSVVAADAATAMSAWTQNEKMQSHVLKCVILMARVPASYLASSPRTR